AARARFFFQAEGGIRDFHVTGVQTCALPISRLAKLLSVPVAPPAAPRILPDDEKSEPKGMLRELAEVSSLLAHHQLVTLVGDARSEERRAGTEWGARRRAWP